ncbi:MAG: hypothetical protein H6909_01480 [Rickettsiaceae bacterium]|nr:hypothetical protein [Rickettsiaceae bacterium]
MAWTETEDDEFLKNMQKIAAQLQQHKQSWLTNNHEEKTDRAGAAGLFRKEANASDQKYQGTGDPIDQAKKVLYDFAAQVTDPIETNKKEPVTPLTQAFTSSGNNTKPSLFSMENNPQLKEKIISCLSEVTAKITSIMLSKGLGMIAALTVQAAVTTAATILFGPVIGIGASVVATPVATVAGIAVKRASDKLLNKYVKSTVNAIKTSVETTCQVATNKTPTQAR